MFDERCPLCFRFVIVLHASFEVPSYQTNVIFYLLQYDNRDRHEHGHHSHKGGSSRHHDRFGGPLKRSGSRDNSPTPPESSSIYAAHFTETERRITQSPSDSGAQFKSPQEILATSGSVEAVRERNVTNSLLDFFGM